MPSLARTLLRPRVLIGVVFVWSLVAFLPVVRNDFVNWDDFRMFLDNPAHRGPWEGRLWGAWASHRLGEYMPITWMSYALDRSIWRDSASGYHVTSLLLHGVAALAVMALAGRLLRHALGPEPDGHRSSLWVGAAVAALVFAVHPLRAEPVAWVSARGTILGGLFLFLSTLAYVVGWERREAGGRLPPGWLVASLGFFAVSLLARATGLMLPLVLLVLDVYPLRRLGGGPGRWFGPAVRSVWVEKLGFAVLGLLTVPMAYLARGDEVGDIWHFGYDPAIALTWGIYSVGFYVQKTLVPGDLSPVYPMPEGQDTMVASVLVSLGIVVGVTAGAIAVRRRWPGLLTAWVAYALLIAPLSGILPFGRLRGVADRYTYAACIGGAIVAGGVTTLAWRRFRSGRMRPLWAGATGGAILLVLVGWSVLSWHQARVWRNGLTLWGWAQQIHRSSPVVHNNLGWAWAHASEFRRAEEHLRRAVDAWPNNPVVLQTLGRILAAQGRYEESAETFRRAVEVAPDWPEGRTDFGSVLYQYGDTGQAVQQLERAVRLDPDEERAHDYLGRALRAQGRTQEADQHLRRAAELRGQRRQPGPASEPGTADADGHPGLPAAPVGGGFRPKRRRARGARALPRKTATSEGSVERIE